MSEVRGSWGSKLGFILAASGSAIGLGNIVFFSSNAYKYGGGAFYVPYLAALFLIGIPVMILELGAGRFARRSMPNALFQLAGRRAELAGWFGALNASIITMYYIAILAWILGMWVGSLGPLWRASPVDAFGLASGDLSNSMSYFFNMISGWNPLIYVVLIWVANILIIIRGAKSIEAVVKIFVPLMWLMMIVLIIRGVTLAGGVEGIFFLFTPDFSVMGDVGIWKGAFSQMFFTLSLGFGIMMAYASYLPDKNDDVLSATTISLLNCSFEYIAGLAIFSLLFAFAIAPKASSLSMIFFVVPEGIAEFPVFVGIFGFLFFTLLLMAGLTSSVSLVESVVLSVIDKFRVPRLRVLAGVFAVGLAGSLIFVLPQVVDPGLKDDGTLGFSLVDLFDHWAFGYGLLICGLLELIILGWLHDLDALLAFINENSRFKLGVWFKVLVRYVLPAVVLSILSLSVADEFRGGMYGGALETGSLDHLYLLAFFGWLAFSVGGAVLFTVLRRRDGMGEPS
jgi:NSS family neurotransmitter:Na+ symporter